MKNLFVVMMIASLLNGGVGGEVEKKYEDWEKAAAWIMGAAEVEDLSEEVMEKFERLLEHPLDINAAARGRLVASGLMSTFQVDAVIEYRSVSGDILSFTELGLVPGFSPELAEAMRPFVVLKTDRAPGQTEKLGFEQSLTLRGSIRKIYEESQGEKIWPDAAAAVKYAAQLGERAELRWSTRTTYDDGKVRFGTISAAYYGKRSLGKVIVGNYNARFGQGLAQWSGFDLAGYPTVASFRKNGTGISTTGAFASNIKGIGADWTWGHFTLTTAASLGKNDIAGISNLSWGGKKATIGTTVVYAPVKKTVTASTDWKVGVKILSLFGELAVKNAWSRDDVPKDFEGREGYFGFGGAAGAIWTPRYGTKLALQGRYYSPEFRKDWCGAALGFENKWMSATADAGWHNTKESQQVKTIIQFKPTYEFESLAMAVKPALRVNARWRPLDDHPWRVDLRGDLGLSLGSWQLATRYNALWCQDFGWLWYAEAGRKTGGAGSQSHGSADDSPHPKLSSSIYARFTLFSIDNWDDRIYAYERDAPGSFNVPAYYGRGYALSLVAALKYRHHSANLRASWISYPWNLTEKPSRFELKAQIQL